MERNKKFITSVIDNGDAAFTKLVEGLISNGQPFLGELLESEGKSSNTSEQTNKNFRILDRKAAEPSADASERVVIDDEMLKKCPGVDKLRADTRDKMKTYLQEQVTRQTLNQERERSIYL